MWVCACVLIWKGSFMALHPLSGHKLEPQVAPCEYSSAFIPQTHFLCKQVPLLALIMHPCRNKHLETLFTGHSCCIVDHICCYKCERPFTRLWWNVANIRPPCCRRKAVVWRSFKQAVRLQLMHWMTQWTLITSVITEKQRFPKQNDVTHTERIVTTATTCCSDITEPEHLLQFLL